jgi:hypothetical protein
MLPPGEVHSKDVPGGSFFLTVQHCCITGEFQCSTAGSEAPCCVVVFHDNASAPQLSPLPPLQYLCNGLEEDIAARRLASAGALGGPLSERKMLVRASGKMLLLDKLLPKLRAEGRQVE